MQIAANTKIAALIKANPASIDAIASINKHFEKLKNPMLRKILASRVTIADAARIGGCEVERFYEKLAPLGFDIEAVSPSRLEETNNQITAMPDKLSSLIPQKLQVLDVCDDIASGNDPFKKIMQNIDVLEKDKALLIINTFEPTPLIAILKKKGFASFIEPKGPNLVYSYFWAEDTAAKKAENLPEKTSSDSFDELLIRFAGKVKKIDVRQLEMPQPMILILQELEQLPAGMALFVNHKRVPQYLLPQIQEREFTIAIQEVEPGAVNLLLYK